MLNTELAIDDDVQLTAYEIAKVRWQQAVAKRRELDTKLDGARAALALFTPLSKGDQFSQVVADKAAAYRGDRALSKSLLCQEILQLEAEVEQFGRSYPTEAAAWREACAAEGERLALTQRADRMAAVDRILKAVTELSDAVVAERSVHNQLKDIGCGSMAEAAFEFGSLDEYHSLLSQWKRRLAAAGLVK